MTIYTPILRSTLSESLRFAVVTRLSILLRVLCARLVHLARSDGARGIVSAALLFVASTTQSYAQTDAEPTAEEFASALVTVQASIAPDGRTVPILGDQRTGSGVLIDTRGLIVTVGYLLLEATDITVTFQNGTAIPATLVANDTVSGLALLRADDSAELPVTTPIRLGRSSTLASDERVIVLPSGGLDAAASVRIQSRRQFSAPWEYLLDEAIYTSPPVRNFSGAALINRDAELIGVGTLALQNITDSGSTAVPGNLFIPVDLLKSRLGAMLSSSWPDADNARPWLGLMIDSEVSVSRVLDGSPAQLAGVADGDIILAIDDVHVPSREALYRALWSAMQVDVESVLLVARAGRLQSLKLTPVDRVSWLVGTE
jgi:S1-C subfamily serine protease